MWSMIFSDGLRVECDDLAKSAALVRAMGYGRRARSDQPVDATIIDANWTTYDRGSLGQGGDRLELTLKLDDGTEVKPRLHFPAGGDQSRVKAFFDSMCASAGVSSSAVFQPKNAGLLKNCPVRIVVGENDYGELLVRNFVSP